MSFLFAGSVYFAIQGDVSLGHYAASTMSSWKNADFPISKIAALCEITNRPQEFISSSPYLVCDKLDWIQCRVLIVQRNNLLTKQDEQQAVAAADTVAKAQKPQVKTVPLDPKFKLTLNNVNIAFPDVGDKLQRLEDELNDVPDELHASDTEILKEPVAPSPSKRNGTRSTSRLKAGVTSTEEEEAIDSFEPADEKRLHLLKMLPPPKNPNRVALATIQKEIKAMLKTQKQEGPTKAGFYFDPERSQDNAFCWIIELPQASFDQDIPLAQDMKKHGVKSILMEIRFGDKCALRCKPGPEYTELTTRLAVPHSFPHSPPFFRVVHPRFLPFIHGGGGHVTGGGSICMGKSSRREAW